ncbi:hypothetical protein BLNAU_3763 [Blattamonas nauphoetae]|uniref:Uncharacterized protein n=1 Tax=Blattamonas nauphoetae TaxID=2049346 RepID=A0ABQ9YC25_9EUKA|nr:hypothetical protein BLNAU_3763 [Blattamonas nauphoetae]
MESRLSQLTLEIERLQAEIEAKGSSFGTNLTKQLEQLSSLDGRARSVQTRLQKLEQETIPSLSKRLGSTQSQDGSFGGQLRTFKTAQSILTELYTASSNLQQTLQNLSTGNIEEAALSMKQMMIAMDVLRKNHPESKDVLTYQGLVEEEEKQKKNVLKHVEKLLNESLLMKGSLNASPDGALSITIKTTPQSVRFFLPQLQTPLKQLTTSFFEEVISPCLVFALKGKPVSITLPPSATTHKKKKGGKKEENHIELYPSGGTFELSTKSSDDKSTSNNLASTLELIVQPLLLSFCSVFSDLQTTSFECPKAEQEKLRAQIVDTISNTLFVNIHTLVQSHLHSLTGATNLVTLTKQIELSPQLDSFSKLESVLVQNKLWNSDYSLANQLNSLIMSKFRLLGEECGKMATQLAQTTINQQSQYTLTNSSFVKQTSQLTTASPTLATLRPQPCLVTDTCIQFAVAVGSLAHLAKVVPGHSKTILHTLETSMSTFVKLYQDARPVLDGQSFIRIFLANNLQTLTFVAVSLIPSISETSLDAVVSRYQREAATFLAEGFSSYTKQLNTATDAMQTPKASRDHVVKIATELQALGPFVVSLKTLLTPTDFLTFVPQTVEKPCSICVDWILSLSALNKKIIQSFEQLKTSASSLVTTSGLTFQDCPSVGRIGDILSIIDMELGDIIEAVMKKTVNFLSYQQLEQIISIVFEDDEERKATLDDLKRVLTK